LVTESEYCPSAKVYRWISATPSRPAEPNAAPLAREAGVVRHPDLTQRNEAQCVLLIGDSIARDYYPVVEKRLAGKAFVARLATSRFVADGFAERNRVGSDTKFEVIVFNNGMHGWQHGEAKYRQAF
jgi:hypothetical protein